MELKYNPEKLPYYAVAVFLLFFIISALAFPLLFPARPGLGRVAGRPGGPGQHDLVESGPAGRERRPPRGSIRPIRPIRPAASDPRGGAVGKRYRDDAFDAPAPAHGSGRRRCTPNSEVPLGRPGWQHGNHYVRSVDRRRSTRQRMTPAYTGDLEKGSSTSMARSVAAPWGLSRWADDWSAS